LFGSYADMSALDSLPEATGAGARNLPPELVDAILQLAVRSAHQEHGDGLVSLREAARLVAGASVNRLWRAAAQQEVGGCLW